MSTNLGVIRGATEQEVLSKKFNIYVGISLGNKWFTKDHIKEHLLWALKHTKERAGLLVADTLHAINYEVKEKKSVENARKKALRKGDEMISILKEIIKELPKEQQSKVDIIRWDDVKANDYYKDFLSTITKEYEKYRMINGIFQR